MQLHSCAACKPCLKQPTFYVRSWRALATTGILCDEHAQKLQSHVTTGHNHLDLPAVLARSIHTTEETTAEMSKHLTEHLAASSQQVHSQMHRVTAVC